MRLATLWMVFFASAAFCQDAPAQPAWNSLKIGETSTKRAVDLFGTPDYVRIDLGWSEFNDHQRRPRQLDRYSFEYAPIRKDTTVFRGPLGHASSAELYFENGTLTQSQWIYRGSTLNSAHTAWLSDASHQLQVTGKLLNSSKRLRGSAIFVSCPLGDKPLTCLDQITVLISRGE